MRVNPLAQGFALYAQRTGIMLIIILRVIGVAGTCREVEGRRKLRDSNRKNSESGMGQIDILPLPIWLILLYFIDLDLSFSLKPLMRFPPVS